MNGMKMNNTHQYEDLLREVYTNGEIKTDRTGTGTKSIFGPQIEFDLSKGFPLITSKKVNFRAMALELLWFLNGDTNIKWLQEQGVHIWDEWASESGDLGPIYGFQWRNWQTADGNSIDQISNLVKQLKENPDSRRHIVSAWNVGQLDQMSLQPCHLLTQFYISNGKLSCKLYQRSADMFLGVPFNIASYSLLVHMLAQQLDLEPGTFIWTGGDCHIYSTHIKQVEEQLSRETFSYPELVINRKPESIFDYKIEDFEIKNYVSHGFIKGEVAV